MSPLGKHGRNKTSHPVNTGTYLKQIADHFSQVPSDAVVRLKQKQVSIGRREETEPVLCCTRFSKTQFKAALGDRKSQVKLATQVQEAMDQLQAVVARHHGPHVAEQIFGNLSPGQLNAGFVSRLEQRTAAVEALNELGLRDSPDWDGHLKQLLADMADADLRSNVLPPNASIEQQAKLLAANRHVTEAAMLAKVTQQVNGQGIYPPPYDSARKQAIQTIMEGALALHALTQRPIDPVQASVERYVAAKSAMNAVTAYHGNPLEQARALRDLPADPAFFLNSPAQRQTSMAAYAFRSALQQHCDKLVRAHQTARIPPTAKEAAAAQALADAAQIANPVQLAHQVLNAGYPFDLATLELAKKSFQVHRDITPEGLRDAWLEHELNQPGLTLNRRTHLLQTAIAEEAQRTAKPTDAFGPDSFVAQRLKKPWTASANKPSPFQSVLTSALPLLVAQLKATNPGMSTDAELIKICARWFRTHFLTKTFADSLPPDLRHDMALAMAAIDQTTHSPEKKRALKMVWFSKLFGQALVEAIEAHANKGSQPDAEILEAARILRELLLEPVKTKRTMAAIDPVAAQQAGLIWQGCELLVQRIIT